MAKKRMISMDIVDSDDFLDLPISTKLLYYDLCVRADDDGFISGYKRILKLNGCSEEDITNLHKSEYIYLFDNGVVVIKHWNIHNHIRSDRHSKTLFQNEYRQLYEDENRIYCYNYANGIPYVIPVVGIDKNRLEEKYRIDENSEEILYCAKSDGFVKEFEILWSKYPKKKNKKEALEYYIEARNSGVSFDTINEGIDNYNDYILIDGLDSEYIAIGSTWFRDCRWEDEY